jgi:hypothetical protein
MTWILKHKLAAGIAAAVVLLLWSNRKAVAAATGPAPIRGRVDSGNAFGYFDTNPDSSTFGERIYGTYGWED